MRWIVVVLCLPALSCGGSPTATRAGHTPGPTSDADATAPTWRPDESEVGSALGRVRSIEPLTDGRWGLSRLLTAGAVPAVAEGAEVQSLEGWSAEGVLSLRFSPDGTQVAFTKVSDPARPEVWIRPIMGDARKVANGYLLAFAPDGAHLLVAASSGTDFASATLDLVEIATGNSRTLVPASAGQLLRGAAVSPDGSQVAFLRYPAASSAVIEPSDIFVVPTAGGEPRRVTSDGAGCLDLAWTPDSSLILHSAQRGENRDIWAVPAAGGAPARVAGTPGEDGVPSVSRDGTTLRWAVFEGAHSKLVLHEAGRGAPPRVLSEGDADRIEPALSPDGFQIAYVLTQANAANLQLGRLEGGAPLLLTETAEPEALPAWAPDGSSLVYLSPLQGAMEIVQMLMPAGAQPPPTVRVAPPPLTSGANVSPRSRPSFSSDGRNLLYVTVRDGRDALMRLPLGGGEPAPVAPEVLSYSWDPRLPAVLFIRPKQDGGTEIVRARLDGSRRAEVLRVDVQQLTLLGPAADSNAVFALEQSEEVRVVRMDLATGRREPLAAMPQNLDPLRLWVDVSRDGRWVAASQAQVTTRIREMRNFGGRPR